MTYSKPVIGRDNASLRALFGAPVVIREARPCELPETLVYPEELAHVKRAVERRRAEFCTARVLAREALAELGTAAGALVPGPDRAPVWPAGVVGSISHTSERCLVVVGSAGALRGLGIDIERACAVETELWPTICTEAELAWVEAAPVAERNGRATILFSAKEAFYKCQYPVTGTFLDFRDVELQVDLDAKWFRVRVLRGLEPSQVSVVETAVGRFIQDPTDIVTAAMLRA